MYEATSFDMAIDSMMSMVERVPAKLGWSGSVESEPSTSATLATAEKNRFRFDGERTLATVEEVESRGNGELESRFDDEMESRFDDEVESRFDDLESIFDEESTVGEFSARSIVEIGSNHSDNGDDWGTKCSESRDTIDECKSTCSTIESKPVHVLKAPSSRGSKKSSHASKSKRSMNDSASRVSSKEDLLEIKTQPQLKSDRPIAGSATSRSTRKSMPSESGSRADLVEVHSIDSSKHGESTVGKEGMKFITEVRVKGRHAKQETVSILDEAFPNNILRSEDEEEESHDDGSAFAEGRTMAKSEHALKREITIAFSDDSSLSTHATASVHERKVAETKKELELLDEESILASFSNDSSLSTRKSNFFKKPDVKAYRESKDDESTISTRRSRVFRKPDARFDMVSEDDFLQQNVEVVLGQKRRNILSRTFGRLFGRRHQRKSTVKAILDDLTLEERNA
jgi:hypothetical protein